MHAKLKAVFAILVLSFGGRALAAELAMDKPLTTDDVEQFSWPQFTVQKLSEGERRLLVVCKSTGSGLVRRKCFIYSWDDDASKWIAVVAFRGSTSRIDSVVTDGKLVLTSYGGKVLLELTVDTLWPYYDPAELQRPRQKGKADEDTIKRMKSQ